MESFDHIGEPSRATMRALTGALRSPTVGTAGDDARLAGALRSPTIGTAGDAMRALTGALRSPMAAACV